MFQAHQQSQQQNQYAPVTSIPNTTPINLSFLDKYSISELNALMEMESTDLLNLYTTQSSSQNVQSCDTLQEVLRINTQKLQDLQNESLLKKAQVTDLTFKVAQARESHSQMQKANEEATREYLKLSAEDSIAGTSKLLAGHLTNCQKLCSSLEHALKMKSLTVEQFCKRYRPAKMQVKVLEAKVKNLKALEASGYSKIPFLTVKTEIVQ
jgi:hypothetical protein